MPDPASPQPRGVYAAVLTPLDQNYEPDAALFVRQCRWLLENGCDGLAPLGTTGEANSLSVEQRIRLIEAAAGSGIPMAKFIPGAGSCALVDAVKVTAAAVAAGAAGALLLPPFYYKNPSEEGLFAFFSEVIQRVGDARLRLYLYHFPQLSTVPITASLIARLMKAYPDGTIAGLKDSSGDWSNTARLLKEFPGFGVFSGSEEFLLANLRAGGVGCISASTNVTAPLARPVYLAWQQANADELQKALTEVRLVLQSYPMQAALKQVCAAINGNTSWLNILPPNRPLTAAQASELTQRLAGLPQMKPILGKATKAA
ncbi:MAG: dihydrodipicolinate synthase family protein [Alphaproteobacteria bacterium]|nr:dihydrodipicolinate synthase family protein [Alphaproteobacteria bacterium]